MKIVNIIVILLSVCSNFCAWGQQKNVNQLSREEEKDGFQLLFDGQSLNNWINNAEEYFVEDGCIVKKSSGFGNLYSKEEFGNFILRFEFQLTPGANNGLGLRPPLCSGRHRDSTFPCHPEWSAMHGSPGRPAEERALPPDPVPRKPAYCGRCVALSRGCSGCFQQQ